MEFDFRNLTEEELMEYDLEELKQLKGISVKSREQNNAVIQQAEKEKVKQELTSGLIKGNTSAAQAAVKGALQGISMGGVDEVDSALAATKDTIEATYDAVDKQGMAGFNNVFSTWKQSYSGRHKAYNAELKQLEEDHPEIYNAADMAGSLAIGSLTGGSAIGARLGATTVGKIALLAGEGAVHGALRSDAETLGGRAEGAGVGAATGAVVGGALKGAGFLARKTAETLGPNRLVQFLSQGHKDFNKEVSGDTLDFAKRLISYRDKTGTPLLQFMQTPSKALQSVKKGVKEVNEDLGQIYTSIDDQKAVDVDVEYIFNKLKNRIVDPIADFGDDAIGSSQSKKTQQDLLKRLERDFMMDDPNGVRLKQPDGSEKIMKVFKKGGLSLLNRLKNDYFAENALVKASRDGSNKLSLNNHIGKAGKELASEVDKYVSDASHKLKVDGSDVDLYSLWKSKSTEFKDLMSSTKLLEDRITGSKGKTIIQRAFHDHWGKMSVGATVAMSMYGASYTDTAMVVGSLGAIASIPTLNKAAAIGVTSIAAAMKKNPDKYTDIASRLAVAASVSSNAFYERLMEAGAEVDLREIPIERSFQDVLARQDSILTLLESKAPRQGRLFREALRTQNKNQLSSILVNTPELQEYIVPGLGWEGKAVSEEEQKEVMNYLRGSLKPRERRKATLKFAGDLMIPSEMLTGESSKKPETKVIYEKVKDKFNRDM